MVEKERREEKKVEKTRLISFLCICIVIRDELYR